MRDSGLAAWVLAVGLALVVGCSGKLPDDLVARCAGQCAARFQASAGRPAPTAALAGANADWRAFQADMDVMVGAPATAPSAGGPATRPAATTQPAPWQSRRGPAYKGDWLHSFGRDAKELPLTLWDDTKATFTNPWALLGLGAAGAVGIVINASGSDNRVADHYTRHGSQLSKFGDMVGDVGGNPGTHFSIAGLMYFTSLATDDVKGYETSKALINALAINGLTTLALKGLVRTHSPNGDPCGWPSGHTSSSFTLATVLGEAYGPWVGVPLFAFASFVGYERIDARNHDFSDVLSGALMGIAIGHAVMQNHKFKVFGFEIIPWADPAQGTVGLALTRRF